MVNPRNGTFATKNHHPELNQITSSISTDPNKKTNKENKVQVQFNYHRKKYFEKEKKEKQSTIKSKYG